MNEKLKIKIQAIGGENNLERGKYALPLYLQVKRCINKKILKGEFQVGDMIPSESCLMSEFGVSRFTVVRALSEMQHEGKLLRVHGKGTFVKKEVPAFLNNHAVGIVFQTAGHLYESLTGEIIKQMHEHKYYCVVLDARPMEKNAYEAEKLKALIEGCPSFIVAHGYSRLPFALFRKYNGKTIFVHLFESNEEYKADYVLSDYCKGGELVAKHFLAGGFKRIVIYLNDYYKNPMSRDNFIKGGMAVFMDKGLSRENIVIIKGPSEDVLFKELNRIEKPLAVFCDSDYSAKPVYEFANENGLQIPEDISVIGYYNTPWCEIFQPELSSVSIREQEIAKLVVNKIVGKPVDR